MMKFDKIAAVDEKGARLEITVKTKNDGDVTRIIITPTKDCRIGEVIIYNALHNFGASDQVYMDGYSKLSQYGGTAAEMKSLNYFSDAEHYKMPQVQGFFTGYNFMRVKLESGYLLVGASSCNYYRVEFRINNEQLQIAQCLENKFFSAGKDIELESMFCQEGKDINALLDIYSTKINANHPPRKFCESPIGWCSWYCIGPDVSENKIFDNLTVIKEKLPELKYIQIDDGFQPFMGDWLKVSDKFSRNMQDICRDIKQRGFEPAIWLAPFIASAKSDLFKEHPEYFVKDNNGAPLCSQSVTFPGWRDAPWYFIDGSNPAALKFIYDVVHTIYKDWGVKYFKLDANMWGALPFGNRYDLQCTSVEAYRKGMQTIWDATEGNAFILGCNAPMWPSLGLVSGMRITGDVVRKTKSMAGLSDECFRRNWMNNLWDNDPDCLIMADARMQVMDAGGRVKKNCSNKLFYKLNNIYVRASGGIVLSGDYVAKYGKEQIDRIKRILSLPRIPAKFDDNLEYGVIEYGNAKEYCVFNKTKFLSKIFKIKVKDNATVTDMYYNKPMQVKDGEIIIKLKKYDSAWIKVED